MASMTFVNLPVKDLKRSVSYFTKLGYEFNPQFTDENATCMIINDNTFAMLLVEKYFQTFTKKTLVDAHKQVEVLVALSLDSREAVDKMAKAALAAGGTETRDPQDLGFMYNRALADPDGHVWEYFWMDPNGPPQE